jgi:hypothetical protein
VPRPWLPAQGPWGVLGGVARGLLSTPSGVTQRGIDAPRRTPMENQLRHILRQHSRSLADRLAEQLAHRSSPHSRELDRSILSVRCRMLVEALVRSAWEGSEQLGEYVSTVADGRLEEGFELEELQRALSRLPTRSRPTSPRSTLRWASQETSWPASLRRTHTPLWPRPAPPIRRRKSPSGERSQLHRLGLASRETGSGPSRQ